MNLMFVWKKARYYLWSSWTIYIAFNSHEEIIFIRLDVCLSVLCQILPFLHCHLPTIYRKLNDKQYVLLLSYPGCFFIVDYTTWYLCSYAFANFMILCQMMTLVYPKISTKQVILRINSKSRTKWDFCTVSLCYFTCCLTIM